MESLEGHEAGFPPFPHSSEIPSGALIVLYLSLNVFEQFGTKPHFMSAISRSREHQDDGRRLR
jgi:hypothetical protein